MDSTGKIAKKIFSNADVVFLLYAIKRWNKIPTNYNKVFSRERERGKRERRKEETKEDREWRLIVIQLVYATILSPIMLTCGWQWHDILASGYSSFFLYPLSLCFLFISTYLF